MIRAEFDDETLMAFADGEVDDATAERIEKALETDDELVARVALFMTTRARASEALRPLLDEKIPDELLQSVKAMVDKDMVARNQVARQHDMADNASGGAEIIAFKRPGDGKGPARFPAWTFSAAASLLLAIGIGAGYFLGKAGTPATEFAAIADPAIAWALSGIPSGQQVDLPGSAGTIEPVLSFNLEDGTFCREFKLRGKDAKGIVSIACLEQDRWHTHLVLATTRPEEGYVPAGSVETIDAYLSSIHAGAPLEGQEEAKLLQTLRK